MGKYVQHHPCPSCGSRDNLAEYTDNYYCWGCGYVQQKKVNINSWKEAQQEMPEEESSLIQLPEVTHTIPKIGREWLDKFELTEEEIYEHIRWSESNGTLVFPIYGDDNNLLMYQERYVDDRRNRKYNTKGFPETVYHFLYPKNIQEFSDANKTTIIIVEDLISAIKVGRVCTAMPLWGSHISFERLRILAKQFKYLGIWLDHDKALYSIRSRSRATLLFKGIASIVTEYDPKCYSTDEIKEILTNGCTI